MGSLLAGKSEGGNLTCGKHINAVANRVAAHYFIHISQQHKHLSCWLLWQTVEEDWFWGPEKGTFPCSWRNWATVSYKTLFNSLHSNPGEGRQIVYWQTSFGTVGTVSRLLWFAQTPLDPDCSAATYVRPLETRMMIGTKDNNANICYWLLLIMPYIYIYALFIVADFNIHSEKRDAI